MQKASHIKLMHLLLGSMPLWVGGLGHANSSLTPERLAEETVAWVAKQQGLTPEDVGMAPLDPRLKIRPCDGKLSFEFPFPSAETVKINCKNPSWHLFVRMNLPGPNAKPGLASVDSSKPAVPQRRMVWVLESPASAGSLLQARQAVLVEREIGPSMTQLLDSKADIQYMELARDLPAGAVLRTFDLRPMLLIRRGQMVQLNIGQSKGFLISARVEAMQDGRYGEQVKLKNPESGRTLTGVVRAPGLLDGS